MRRGAGLAQLGQSSSVGGTLCKRARRPLIAREAMQRCKYNGKYEKLEKLRWCRVLGTLWRKETSGELLMAEL